MRWLARYLQVVARTLDLRRFSLLDLALIVTVVEFGPKAGFSFWMLAVVSWLIISAICRALAEVEIVE